MSQFEDMYTLSSDLLAYVVGFVWFPIMHLSSSWMLYFMDDYSRALCSNDPSLSSTSTFMWTTGCLKIIAAESRYMKLMDLSTTSVMAAKAYSYKAESFVKEYLLADSYVPYTAVLGGILMCKMVYDITHLVSSFYYKSYGSLTKTQKIEWNNRGMSTVHAIFITFMSVYLVFFSDIFSDQLDGPVTFRSSNLSNFTLGVSVGYFITDLAMILWVYPSLGGMEYVLHHLLSIISIVYAMYSGEGQLYTYMVLISETTTPGINLRWFLDTAGMKRSRAYLVNGVSMFVAWLVARIILFIYLFYHIYFHYDQVKLMHTFSYLLIFAVPTILLIMNTMWFAKILRGLKKTLAKRQ